MQSNWLTEIEPRLGFYFKLENNLTYTSHIILNHLQVLTPKETHNTQKKKLSIFHKKIIILALFYFSKQIILLKFSDYSRKS